MEKETYIIGVDVGGTHISSAIVALNQKKLLENTYATSHVANMESQETILDTWANCLNKTLKKANGLPLTGIAFAMPGPFDYNMGVAKYPEGFKYGGLFGTDIEKSLNPLLAHNKVLPVRFLNDATSFAVGEAWLAESEGYKKQLCITLGTGLGAGFIDNGIPVTSGGTVPPNGILWNIPYKDGIADDYFSTRGCINGYAEATGRTVKGVKQLADAYDNDFNAKQVLENFGGDLGRFLSPWLTNFDADVLVLGGNISKAYGCFGNTLQQVFNANALSITIRISKHMEKGAIIGCTRLFDDTFWQSVKNDLPSI
ncbi:ROK family protein [Flagellimonas sp. S3867]|uniref:ROK family protein n=1 Tax=Flagellimonas sp. S3867 TaxID=2768063 RepID=UPI001681CA6C|nr:ROK family protein [Flagellimonas sp. S3867]